MGDQLRSKRPWGGVDFTKEASVPEPPQSKKPRLVYRVGTCDEDCRRFFSNILKLFWKRPVRVNTLVFPLTVSLHQGKLRPLDGLKIIFQDLWRQKLLAPVIYFDILPFRVLEYARDARAQAGLGDISLWQNKIRLKFNVPTYFSRITEETDVSGGFSLESLSSVIEGKQSMYYFGFQVKDWAHALVAYISGKDDPESRGIYIFNPWNSKQHISMAVAAHINRVLKQSPDWPAGRELPLLSGICARLPSRESLFDFRYLRHRFGLTPKVWIQGNDPFCMLWSLWFGYLFIRGDSFKGAIAQMTLEDSRIPGSQVGNYQGLYTFFNDVVCSVQFAQVFNAEAPPETDFAAVGISPPLWRPLSFEDTVTEFVFNGSLLNANIDYCDKKGVCTTIFRGVNVYDKLLKTKITEEDDKDNIPSFFGGKGTHAKEDEIYFV